jgi:hypothetical protein
MFELLLGWKLLFGKNSLEETMFSIFRRNNIDALESSKLFNEHGFYGAFSKDMRLANNKVVIESPYITIRRSTEFVELVRKIDCKASIQIYTRNPYHHEGRLVTESLEGIKILKRANIKVYSCDDMRHRKLAIIDNHILWEGSLNMLSQNGSVELMRRTVSKSLCNQMNQFLGLKWYSRS